MGSVALPDFLFALATAVSRADGLWQNEPQTSSDQIHMWNRAVAVATLLFVAGAAGCADARRRRSQQPRPTAKPEEGIPITDATVQKACGVCHRPDDKGQMSRISFQRNTPEGWQDTIQRMVALNGLKIDPPTAREVVKYLSNNLGLAPEEAKPAAYEVERRLIDYKYTRERRRGIDLQQVPLARARDFAAPHARANGNC